MGLIIATDMARHAGDLGKLKGIINDNDIKQDRPDVAYTATELCREFSAPTLQSLARLKKLIRYIRGAPPRLWWW